MGWTKVHPIFFVTNLNVVIDNAKKMWLLFLTHLEVASLLHIK